MRITKEAILSTLPVVLAEDANTRALAEALAEQLAARIPEIDLVRIYTRIDELPEELLDILAYDFKAEWWEYNATLAEKREVFKKIWYVHRHKGTKGSVETAVGALYPYSSVSEWYEYSGEPYHFRMNVPIRREDAESTGVEYKERIFWLVHYFKNLRSVLDTIYFEFETPMETELFVGAHLGRGLTITPIPEFTPEFKEEVELFLSGMMPRWWQTVIGNDETQSGLGVKEIENEKALLIYSYLEMLGNHPITAWEDPETLTLHIENEGLTVYTEGTAIVIEGG